MIPPFPPQRCAFDSTGLIQSLITLETVVTCDPRKNKGSAFSETALGMSKRTLNDMGKRGEGRKEKERFFKKRKGRRDRRLAGWQGMEKNQFSVTFYELHLTTSEVLRPHSHY